MRHPAGTVAVFWAAWVLTAPSAWGTTLHRVPLTELVSRSPSIVHGTVVATQSRWTEDRTTIVTDVHVRVAEALRGAPVSDVVVTHPGGRVGKLEVQVDGAAAFRVGEEVVLFLGGSGSTRFVTGLSQGRFEVVEESRSGRKVIRGLTSRDLRTLMAPSGGSTPITPSGSTAQPLAADAAPVELGEFLKGLRTKVPDLPEGTRK